MVKKLTLLTLLISWVTVACDSSGNTEALQGLHLVAKDNCGVAGQQEHHVMGNNWAISESVISYDIFGADNSARTNVYSGKIQYEYKGLDPDATYKFRLTYLSDNHTRSIRLKADGVVVDDDVRLPFSELVTRVVDLPAGTYDDGKVVLEFEQVSGSGSDAIVSMIELFSNSKELVPFLDVSVGVADGQVKGCVFDENNNAFEYDLPEIMTCFALRSRWPTLR